MRIDTLQELDAVEFQKSAFDIIQLGSTSQPFSVSDSVMLKVYDALSLGGRVVVHCADSAVASSSATLAGFEVGGDESSAIVTAKKPAFDAGASISLRRGPKTLEAVVVAADYSSDSDELIDDADILLDDDYDKPDPSDLKEAGDCSTSKKACKNCSCGRAEMESAVKLDTDDSDIAAKAPPKSSCGNCSLGDAFRCSGCPYLGMPAFTPGQKVVLNL